MTRKIIAIIFIFCLLFVIAGCQSEIQTEEEAANEISNANEEITSITEDLQQINSDIEETPSS